MNQMTGDILPGGRMAEEDFARIAALLHRLTGIYLTEAKRAMVVSRLGRRVKALGLDGLTSYVDLIHSPAGTDELEEMIQALTTNMTRFDREAAQFVHFETDVMPALAARARAGERVRLWSAGCSSGEEPYSLGFRVLDQCPEAPGLDLRILATDIDRKILNRAIAGRYAVDQLAPLSKAHRERYFSWPEARSTEKGEGLAGISGELRAIIAFRVLNLLADWPFRGQFDAIMCRNVTIYFDAETQARLWRRFSERLVPGGILYIGHSESVSADVLADFETLGAGVFRKLASAGVGQAHSGPSSQRASVRPEMLRKNERKEGNQ